MGGVCPCFAGVDKAVGGTKPAAATDKANVPLKETELPPAAAAVTEPVAPNPPVKSTVPEQAPPNVSTRVTGQNEPPASTGQDQPPAYQEAPAIPMKMGEEAAPAEAQGENSGEVLELGPGSCLEVWSNTYNSWCPGIINACDTQSVLMAYQVPGEPIDANISTKTLPIDSNEIRHPTDTGSWLTASVEVYSHSNKAWCLGKVTEINGGIASVVFFYPNEPPDAVPVMKQLALGDKDLRLRGVDAAFAHPVGGLGHEALVVGSAVEVYSNSLSLWCPGIVNALDEGTATIHFYYPDMDPSNEQPAVKDLPLGHQDLRLPGYAAGSGCHSGPPVTEADLKEGGQLEVFSQSRGVWLVSEIKSIADGMVTVQLRYPDMPPDSDLFEKVLPMGHTDMRLPTNGDN